MCGSQPPLTSGAPSLAISSPGLHLAVGQRRPGRGARAASRTGLRGGSRARRRSRPGGRGSRAARPRRRTARRPASRRARTRRPPCAACASARPASRTRARCRSSAPRRSGRSPGRRPAASRRSGRAPARSRGRRPSPASPSCSASHWRIRRAFGLASYPHASRKRKCASSASSCASLVEHALDAGLADQQVLVLRRGGVLLRGHRDAQLEPRDDQPEQRLELVRAQRRDLVVAANERDHRARRIGLALHRVRARDREPRHARAVDDVAEVDQRGSTRRRRPARCARWRRCGSPGGGAPPGRPRPSTGASRCMSGWLKLASALSTRATVRPSSAMSPGCSAHGRPVEPA